jgi:DNA-binding PadR family transcriptional regulator
VAATGDPGPQGLGCGCPRDIVRDYVIEHLADDNSVLVIDETGFLKQGKATPLCSGISCTLVDGGSAARHPNPMQTKPRRSSLGLMILCILSEEPTHPYRVQKLIRERGKDRVVNVRQRGSVYQTLGRLERLGLIEVQGTVQTESHPDRTIYAITDFGRSTAKTWLLEILGTIEEEFPEFPAGISVLAMLTPEEVRKQFESRAGAVEAALSQFEAERQEWKNLPRLFLLEDEYRAAVLKTELKWLQTVIADLDSKALDWNEQWVRKIAAEFASPDPEDS